MVATQIYKSYVCTYFCYRFIQQHINNDQLDSRTVDHSRFISLLPSSSLNRKYLYRLIANDRRGYTENVSENKYLKVHLILH